MSEIVGVYVQVRKRQGKYLRWTLLGGSRSRDLDGVSVIKRVFASVIIPFMASLSHSGALILMRRHIQQTAYGRGQPPSAAPAWPPPFRVNIVMSPLFCVHDVQNVPLSGADDPPHVDRQRLSETVRARTVW